MKKKENVHLEKAKLLCDEMSFRDFCRKKNFHRLLPDKREREEAADLLKPLFTAFDKKEKQKKAEKMKMEKKGMKSRKACST